MTTLQPQHFGTIYRTFRLAGFVARLWLLTPWWGRRDLLLVRSHLAVLSAVLGSVVLGLVIAPGTRSSVVVQAGSAARSGRSRPRRSRTMRRS